MMPKKYDNYLERVSKMNFQRNWKIAVSLLSCIIIFYTGYSLIVPAITLSAQEANCGYEEHYHTEECMNEEGEIVCGFEEHEHSLECYSDLYEDIENDDVWRTSVPLLSGDRNADTVAVAASQIGYR